MNTDKLPTLPRPAPPRLRIHHLMACVAVAALRFTLWRNTLPAGTIDQLPASLKVIWSIGLSFAAVGLTFALLSVYWQLKGYAALAQPGQWLPVRYLIDFAQLLIGWLVVSHLEPTAAWGKSFAFWNNQDYYYAVASVLNAILSNTSLALPALFYAWCAWRVADTRSWRILFSLSAIGSLLEAVRIYGFMNMNMPSAWSMSQELNAGIVFTSILTLSVLGRIVVTEYRRQQRYWTHWLGVGLCVATTALEFASGVMNCIGWY